MPVHARLTGLGAFCCVWLRCFHCCRCARLAPVLQVKGRDLSRFVKWPRYVRIQRQRQILHQRLSVPPAVNQFSNCLEKNQATELFKLLNKYRPESKAEKKERLASKAEAVAAGEAPDHKKAANQIKFGLKHVTALIEEKRASLVVIASDVDPIELVVWMPALCRKMDVPYAIVKNRSRLGALVHQKTATCLALTSVNSEDANTLRTLQDNFMAAFNESKMKWSKEGKPVMGLKTQRRLEKRQKQIEAELAKKRSLM